MAEEQEVKPNGPLTIEVGGTKYEVSAEFLAAFEKIRDSLVGKGMPEDIAIEQAWNACDIMVASGMLKKASKPEEVVPDLAEIARPIVEKALEKNKQLQTAIEAYVAAVADFDEQCEAHGLPMGLTLEPAVYTSFVKLSGEWPGEVVTKVDYRVDPKSDLAKTALAVPDRLRVAEAAVFAIVKTVADKNGISMDGLKVTVAVDHEGKVSLEQGTKRARKTGSRGGTGSRASYDLKEEGDNYIITKKNGEDTIDWVTFPKSATEAEALAAVKAKMDSEGKTFAAVHWRGSDANKGKSWWPY